jgi:hypothetical protein
MLAEPTATGSASLALSGLRLALQAQPLRHVATSVGRQPGDAPAKDGLPRVRVRAAGARRYPSSTTFSGTSSVPWMR